MATVETGDVSYTDCQCNRKQEQRVLFVNMRMWIVERTCTRRRHAVYHKIEGHINR